MAIGSGYREASRRLPRPNDGVEVVGTEQLSASAASEPVVAEEGLHVSLRELAEARMLEEWDEHRPRDLVVRVEEVFRELIFGLIDVEPAAGQAAKVILIRKAVEKLNELNDAQPFIDTIEREDLCGVFDHILHLVGVDDAQDVVDKHRSW